MYSRAQIEYFKEYILLKNSGSDVSRISNSLFESKIALNPHQINAALSFFKNPKKKGMIFADEVGLGKTIEAGLVISQYWYEQKRRILIICPASLIKQWNEELLDKFHLSSYVLDGKSIKSSGFCWENGIYISSINTVYLNKEKFTTQFDLIVIDEAHKLRNVYKDKGIMAPAIKEVFNGQKKLLLTATPFQNNLQELFGLMSLIDDDIFPDFNVFKEKYIKNFTENKGQLSSIIKTYAVRTLRKEVVKYINYTKRNVILANYELSDKELQLYERVEELIYSDDMFNAYGTSQLHLIILLLQKLLSSSIYAVRSTLNNILGRLEDGEGIEIDIGDDEEKVDFQLPHNKGVLNNIKSVIDYIDSVPVDSKLNRLIDSINEIYEEINKDSARSKKILIFTESKKTQEYLYVELKNRFDNILLFNGENSSTQTNEVYLKWLEKHGDENRVDKNIAIRRAIVDAFEHDYEILIATDAAAEGLNLQFCSVIINYDLPWNPQKIEQRIGRCHRYGQKNDVIVVNMLNNSSSIDKRIYELLSSKIGIFDETFGSSDRVLGSSSIADDIESAIRDIYKSCRNPEEIEQRFEALQTEFKSEIEAAIKASENDLDRYFDEEVAKAFDLQYIEATRIVDEMADLFYIILKNYLSNAVFDDKEYSFIYNGMKMTVLSKSKNDYDFCSISSELGKNIITSIPSLEPDYMCKVRLDYLNSQKKIGFLDHCVRKTGRIAVSKVSYDSFEKSESLVLSGMLDDGTIIPEDICHKILKLSCSSIDESICLHNEDLSKAHKNDVENRITQIEKNNAAIFQQELEYIDNWADSMIEKIQLSVKTMREERKQLQMECDFTSNIDEKANIQEKIQKLSKKINKSWLELAELEDEVEGRRDVLIANLKAENSKSVSQNKLFEMEIEIA